MSRELLVTSVFACFLKKIGGHAEKADFFVNVFSKFSEVSERIQMHPNASERIRMHLNRSEQVRASPKTSKNSRKPRKKLRKLREKFAKIFANACCGDFQSLLVPGR